MSNKKQAINHIKRVHKIEVEPHHLKSVDPQWICQKGTGLVGKGMRWRKLCYFMTKDKTEMTLHLASCKGFIDISPSNDEETSLTNPRPQIITSNLPVQKCKICQQAFTNYDDLESHILTIHNSGFSYKCDQCHFYAFTRQRVQEHVLKSHVKNSSKNPSYYTRETWVCDRSGISCDFTSKSKDKLNKHKLVCGLPKQIRKRKFEHMSCKNFKFCNFSSSDLNANKIHTKLCSEKTKNLSKNSAKKIKLLKVKQLENSFCKSCANYFKTPLAYYRHLQAGCIKLSFDEVLSLKCDKCDADYKEYSNTTDNALVLQVLKAHKRYCENHEEEALFKCGGCLHDFENFNDFSKHAEQFDRNCDLLFAWELVNQKCFLCDLDVKSVTELVNHINYESCIY